MPDRIVEVAEAGVPPALLPRDAGAAASRVELARLLRYLRSHWV